MATFKDTDTFLINRDGVDYRVSFAELAAAIEERENQQPPEPKPWDDHDGGVFHLKNIADRVTFVNGNYGERFCPVYDLDGNFLGDKDYVEPGEEGEEFIILTDKDCNKLFYDNSFLWEFGKYTNTSNVTNMAWMFANAYTFNADIGGWDTSNVTDMDHMFMNAFEFNQNIGGWDTSKVASMGQMFDGAKKFSQDISGWDTSNVTDMAYMFRQCRFNQDIGGWDTSNVTDMEGMFGRASLFNQNIGGWDTSNVTTMDGMFAAALVFDQDIGGWNTGAVKSMVGMFAGAPKFNQDISQWCVSNVASKPEYFDDKSGFEGQTAKQPQWGTCPGSYPWSDYDGGGVFHVKNATAKVEFRANDYSTTSYPAYDINGNSIGNKSSISPGEEFVFLTGPNCDSLFFNNSAGWAFGEFTNTSKVTRMKEMFIGATGFNQPIGDWNTSNVTDMENMFANATKFNQDLSQWCVTKIPSTPPSFDFKSGFQGQTNKQPKWGTCPRGEG